MAASLCYSEANEKKYKDLVGGPKRNRAFDTYKSIYITSAIIALKLSLDPREIKDKHDFIKDVNLSEIEQRVLRYVALAFSEKPEVLLNQEEVIKITNGLANAGISTLHESLCSSGGDQLYGLLDYSKKYFWKESKTKS